MLQSARSVWRQRFIYYLHIFQNVLQSARSVWRQSTRATAQRSVKPVAICTERVEAKIGNFWLSITSGSVAICTERVEAKCRSQFASPSILCCNLHGACGGKGILPNCPVIVIACCNLHGACGGKGSRFCAQYMLASLQSARSVWRQSSALEKIGTRPAVAICTERVEAKFRFSRVLFPLLGCNLHGACGGKVLITLPVARQKKLQSARSVWRQSC